MLKKYSLIAVLLIYVFPLDAQNLAEKNQLTIFLVRHAEKVDNRRDPELSEIGKQRAAELSKTLISSDIQFIHSTDYIRTVNTAKPTAQLFDLEIEIYNPDNLKSFARKLKKSSGRHLVVGHSNTTPELVELLGGNPGSPIVEDNEYDRLYILTFDKKGKVNTVLLRYGEKFISIE